MPAFTPSDTRRTLMQLDDDDSVGHSVLKRERPLLFPTVAYADADVEPTGEERARDLFLDTVHVIAHGHASGLPSRLNQDNESSASSSHDSSSSYEGECSDSMSSVVTPSDNEKSRQFQCTESDCDRSFTKKSDLTRHTTSVHERHTRYTCPAVGCFKKQAAPTFLRRDKLVAHIRTAHHQSSARFQCWRRECHREGGLTLHELAVHLDIINGAQSKSSGGQHPRWLRRSRHQDSDLELAVAIHNVRHWRRCRVWTCGVSKTGRDYVEHLQSHTRYELEAASAQLLADGLEVHAADHSTLARTDAEHHEHVFMPSKCPLGSCQARPDCEKTCANHILMEHLLLQDQEVKEHFATGFVQDLHWRKPHMRHPNGGTLSSGKCQKCGLEDWKHYLSFFRPLQDVLAEMEPFCVQLLQLCPDLAVHQLYDYLRE